MAAKKSQSAKSNRASIAPELKNSKTSSQKPSTAKRRRLKQNTYKSFRFSKKIRSNKEPLKGSIKLFGQSFKQLWRYRQLFGWLLLIYGLLNLLLVHGFAPALDIVSLKNNLVARGSHDQISNSLNVFGGLINISRTPSSDVAGLYQTFLILLGSLAVIWSLRQTFADKAISVKDSFYKSMYPLVPFILVVLVITLEFLPTILAAFLYSAVFGGGLALTNIEIGLWALFISCLVLLSLYLLSSTIFALYIVTLPDVDPMTAMRSARHLVRFRRWQIMRKFIGLPIILLILAVIIMVPTIMFIPRAAEWVFFTLGLLAFMLVHSYGYTIYRGLL